MLKVFWPWNIDSGNLYLSSEITVYIFGQKGLVPVVCFAQIVETGLWAVWAAYHAPYTQFLARTARKKLNVTNIKGS